MPNADQLIELFNDAKARAPGPERENFLDESCGQDSLMREQIVSLLEADADEAQSDLLRNSPTRNPRPSVTERPGDRIGRYKLLEEIGEGGCGVVYLAEQQEPVRRQVALKVIKLGMDTRSVIARFEAEQQALALMDHPNIARVLDAGATATGRPFFVMELVRGLRITDYCDRNNLPTVDRLGLFIQVCYAIQHAHQKGIIHRDIKPSNILVTINEPGSPGCPKVIDFGIAKATTGQRLTDKTVFTVLDQFLGTPAYMSPEQAMMTTLDIDTRADIYALGVLLYELLIGQTPFDSKELMALDIDAMRRVIRDRAPARPSTRLGSMPASERTRVARHRRTDPARLATLLRGDLDWIVMKALEKDRTRRYETANGLAMDIQRHLNCEPVIARPPSRFYEFQTTVRRHKFGFGVGAALIVVLGLGVLVSTWQVIRTARAERNTATALLDVIHAKAELEVDSYFHRITLAHRELSRDNLRGGLKFLEECPRNLRGWEWNYLNRLARIDPVVLRDTNAVYGVAFHPQGHQIAAACRDGSVKIWDLSSRTVVQTLRGHTNYAFSVAFRPPDGRHLASAGADGMIRVWDLLSGGELFQCPGPAGEYNGMSRAVTFSPDSRNLIADRGDGTVAIWDVDKGTEVHRLKENHENAVTCVDGSADGEFLATGSWGGVLRVWNARTRELLHSAVEHSHRISALSFAGDGRSLATASFDRTLKVWDPTTGKVLRSWEAHSGIISGLVFSPDGRRLVSCGVEDKTVKLWDPLTGREILNLRGPEAMCHSVACSPDGQRFASANQDGTVWIWDASPLKPNETLEFLTCEHDAEVWSVAFSPDGRLLASGAWDNTVRLWDPQTGTNMGRLEHPGSVFRVAFNPNSQQLAASTLTATRGARVTAWDTRSGKELFTIDEKAFPFCAIFDPTGRYVLREGPDFSVKVWDAQTRMEAGMLGAHGFNIWAIRFSPDGRRLMTASSDGFIKLWRWQPGQWGQTQEPELVIPVGIVLGYGDRASFTPDGQRLVTGGKANTVKLWDANTGQELESLAGHTGEVWAVAMDGQNRWLATGGEDTSIRIWDAKSWQPLHTLRGHTGIVMSLAFSPDGRHLASGSRDHTVKLWDTARWMKSPPL